MRSTSPIPRQIAAACRAVREATPRDLVGGVQPSVVAAPESTQEASALLAAATGLGLAVVPRGTGTRLHWGCPPERCDLVLDTGALNRVTEHAAGDLTATVQAGAGLDALAEVLAAAGQRLALDPPAAPLGGGRGTVGGVLAAGVAGPLRLRYGTGRDLLIGITIVLADGTIARSGGKVVKNVAGYDLGKLLAGSRGTLGLIADATFRLHPIPPATIYVVAHREMPTDAAAAIATALEARYSPVAVELDGRADEAPLAVCVALEGAPELVSDRAPSLAAALGGAEISAQPPQWWGTYPSQCATLIQVAFWPGELAAVLDAIAESAVAADPQGEAGVGPSVRGPAAAGLLYVGLSEGVGAEPTAAFVGALRSRIGHVRPGEAGSTGHPGPPPRASAVVLHGPPAVLELADPFGQVPSLSLMRAVKAQFDPGRTLSPGRLAGGI
jgi:glycolate oxidase FAD binding subunit